MSVTQKKTIDPQALVEQLHIGLVADTPTVSALHAAAVALAEHEVATGLDEHQQVLLHDAVEALGSAKTPSDLQTGMLAACQVAVIGGHARLTAGQAAAVGDFEQSLAIVLDAA